MSPAPTPGPGNAPGSVATSPPAPAAAPRPRILADRRVVSSVAGGAALFAACVAWSLSQIGPQRRYRSAIDPPAARAAPDLGQSITTVPPGALAVSLWDDLFPESRPEPEPPPPPRLALELVALLGPAGARRAFVYDADLREYFDLAPGDTAALAADERSFPPRSAEATATDSRPRLLRIDDAGAVFAHAGREVRVELKP